jgi:hypothetical protein
MTCPTPYLCAHGVPIIGGVCPDCIVHMKELQRSHDEASKSAQKHDTELFADSEQNHSHNPNSDDTNDRLTEAFAHAFPRKIGHVSTHYSGCYVRHPACAWLAGYEAGREHRDIATTPPTTPKVAGSQHD